jgi:hypothetical protein
MFGMDRSAPSYFHASHRGDLGYREGLRKELFL